MFHLLCFADKGRVKFLSESRPSPLMPPLSPLMPTVPLAGTEFKTDAAPLVQQTIQFVQAETRRLSEAHKREVAALQETIADLRKKVALFSMALNLLNLFVWNVALCTAI
jgi:hypothetical protein